MKISLVLTLVQPGGVVGCLVINYVQRFRVKKGQNRMIQTLWFVRRSCPHVQVAKTKKIRRGNRRRFVISYTGKKCPSERLISLSLCYSFLMSIFYTFRFSQKRFELTILCKEPNEPSTISIHAKYATFHRFSGIAEYFYFHIKAFWTRLINKVCLQISITLLKLRKV